MKRLGLRLLAVGIATAVFGAMAPHAADAKGSWARLPSLKRRAKPKLAGRFMKYENRRVMMMVKNTTRKTATFDPRGMFFVPQGNPESAPQRMGAVGPFEVLIAGTWKRRDRVKVAPGQTIHVRLPVYCLDSHRSSPSNGQKFGFAVKRLPKALRDKIHQAAEGLHKAGKAAAIQSAVWKHRNSKWIRIQGERRGEKTRSYQKHFRSHRYRHRLYRHRIRRFAR